MIDQEGKQWVVDLDPRFTAFMPFFLTSGHFSKQLGLLHAQFSLFVYKGATGDIYDHLSPMIDSRQAIVLAATDISEQWNMAVFVWGGRDAKAVT